jgi:hypothetical protein
MRYFAPDDRTDLRDPTREQLERVVRTSPHSYWQQGGNSEAILAAGPGEPNLWIKQPLPERFFITYSKPSHNWLVPYDGGPCESLVEDERGGDPFLIPKACLIDTDQAVEVISYFLSRREPSPSVPWCYWHELPIPEAARRATGG